VVADFSEALAVALCDDHSRSSVRAFFRLRRLALELAVALGH